MKNLGKIVDNKDIITKGYLDSRVKSLLSRGSIRIDSETSSIEIPIEYDTTSNLLVYLNGLLLEPDIHYTISDQYILLSNYSAVSGDILSFLYLG